MTKMRIFKTEDEFGDEIRVRDTWGFKILIVAIFIAVVICISISLSKYSKECEKIVEDSYEYTTQEYNYLYDRM